MGGSFPIDRRRMQAMAGSHEGQVVVVTGAGKGIGRAIAER
ncbi:uncharacterized protein METZ01_LOCUS452773, partial [marine metagenome]